MVEALFWVAIAILIYTYVGFPVITLLRARIRPIPVRSADITPTVSLIIIAHNEAAVIQKKLENVLSLNYPKDHLEVIVASDGSNDGTNEIVEQYQDRGITLIALPRRGKVPTLNTTALMVLGEILAFSDANSMYAPDSLRTLVRPFADPTVGGVAGDQRYLEETVASSSAGGEQTYWNIDRALKQWQSEGGSVTSATGAIYAIRAHLFKPVPSGVCDDAMISRRVTALGFRMVFAPEAVAYENVASSPDDEYRRKVRVCTQGLRGLAKDAELFNPFRYGFYSLQILSHKLLRWLAPIWLAIAYFTSLWLAFLSPKYEAFAAVQSIFYGVALAIYLLRRRPFTPSRAVTILTIPFYFCLANVAFLVALVRVLRGQRIDSWEVSRDTNHTDVARPKTESAVVRQ